MIFSIFKRITNLKVAGKLKVYRMTVLVMTLFLVLVALISTLVIRSNIEKITEVWSPALEDLQELETMTAKYRIKQALSFDIILIFLQPLS